MSILEVDSFVQSAGPPWPGAGDKAAAAR